MIAKPAPETLDAQLAHPSLAAGIARAALGRHPDWVSSCDYQDAAKVMGRTLSPETLINLKALHCADHATLEPGVAAWLAALRLSITE